MLQSVGLFVTLVDACNLNCQFCEFPNKKEFRTGESLDCGKFINMLYQMKECPPPIPLGAVSFCGSGEPLLYNNIIEIVSETRKFVPQVSIVTNGVLLTKELCVGLLGAQINHIVVSITGNSTEVYGKYQGSGEKTIDVKEQFELVRQNVEMLVNMRNEKLYSTQIGVSYILSDESKKDYFQALSYWHKIGVDYVDTRILSQGFLLQKDDFVSYIKNNSKWWENDSCCTCFGKVMNVFTDGRIGFCNCSYRDETILGNLYDNSLAEILSSPKFTGLLKSFTQDYMSIPDICKICDLLRARPILA